MKKIIGVGEEGRTRTAGRLAGVRTTATVAGCLMVLVGWTGAAAQGNGFNVVHQRDGVAGWDTYGGGTWTVSDGDAVPGSQSMGFFINTYACKSDGKFTVKFRRNADENYKDQPPSESGGVVFRYSSDASYYYLVLSASGWNNSWQIALYKNRTYTGPDPSTESLGRLGIESGSGPLYSDGAYYLEIVLDGNKFTVNNLNNGGARLAVFEDNTESPLLSGRAGYAAMQLNWGGNNFIRYVSSSWEDTQPDPETLPSNLTNYMAWNTSESGIKFTAGSGSWVGTNWTNTNAGVKRSWIAGSNALFSGAPEGAANAYRITVPSAQTVTNMRFEINGYAIDSGATLTRSAGGSVFVENGKTAAINTVLSGGRLTKDGAGTLTLGATNNYTGGTVISAGKVIANRGGAFGADTVTLNDTLQLGNVGTIANPFKINGGKLVNNSSNSFSGSVALSGAAAVPVAAGENLTFSGVVSGSTPITKTGAGTLIFTGASTNTGAITLSGGGLQIGNNTTTGIINAPIITASGTTVTFSRGTSNVTYAPNITGTGKLVKNGAGTLILGGNNTYSGGTAINAGGITITSMSNIGSGAITMGGAAATLTFSHSGAAAASFSLAVSGGTGIFAKSGTGTLNLTSVLDVATVVVSAGTLNANPGAGLKVDSIGVAAGAALGGTAAIGDGLRATPTKITVSGTVSNTGGYDGNMVLTGGKLKNDGTALTIAGNLTMNGASTLELPLAGLKTAHKITVNNALAINGTAAKLNIIGDIDTGTYKIINALGSVIGNFGEVTVGGVANTDYVFSTKPEGKIVTLTIANKDGDAGAAKNYLTVDTAVYKGDVAGGSSVTLTISGLTALKPYIGAANGARVMSVYVWYKPVSAATVSSAGAVDTGATGGGILIPLTEISGASGNIMTFPFTVPASKSASVDELYFFNVATFWSLDGAAVIVQPSTTTSSKSAYLRNPKTAVKANGLTISIDTVASNTEAGLTFRLTVRGQNGASVTPVDVTKPYKPGVDSVAIWFKRNGAAPTLTDNSPLTKDRVPNSANVWVFSLDSLLKNGALTLSVGPVANDNRDTVYFSIAPRWKGAGVDSLARELSTAPRSVNNSKVEAPTNPVSLVADQADRRASVITVTVGAISSFSAAATEVTVEASFSPTMTDILDKQTLSVTDVSDGYTYEIKDKDEFVGAERTVYFRVTVTDAFGITSDENRFEFVAGRKPPAPVAGFSAEPGANGSMDLSWRAPTPAENNIKDQSSSIIRIYYSENPISADADIGSLNPVTEVSAATTRASVTGLTLNTTYYFAAVLFDIVNASKPDWTLNSLAATCSENTGSGKMVENILSIESAVFENSAFKVTVKLTKDWESGNKYAYIVTLLDDAVPILQSDPIEPSAKTANLTFSFTTEKLLGDALMWDTAYTIQLYVVDDNNNPSKKISKDVQVGAFTEQDVKISVGGSGIVDNGNFKVSTAGWVAWGEPFNATINVSEKGSAEDYGFICVDRHGYSYTINNPDLSIFGAFTISMRARDGGIPDTYSESDVRIYKWNGSYWEVAFDTKYEGEYFTGTAIDSVKRENGIATYRLMINTRKPTITVPPDDEADMSKDVTGESIVKSNVGNFRVSMLGGPAKGTAKLESIKLDNNISGEERRLRFTIMNDIVTQSENFGILAFIIVNDGSGDTIVNLSYRVKSDRYGGFPAADLRNKAKWSPFAAQVELDNKKVRPALEPLFKDGDPFVQLDTLYRLFRYGRNGWTEYDTENDSLFDMKPGRLMWFKTSVKQLAFNFGKAKSMPLRATYDSITLPPNQWTDLVLPFRFSVCLGDILDSTEGSRSSLEFYRWTGGDPKYVAELLNKPGSSADTLELNGENEPFTVFNKGASPITLRIPPNPASLYKSRRRTAKALALAKTTAAQQSAGDAWYYTLRSAADGSELSDVLVGYYPTDMTFAVPPSFGSESAVLVGDDGTEIGHHFGPSIAAGRTYKLRFYNDGGQQREFVFSADPSANTPVGARVTFVRASTGEVLGNGNSSAQSVKVAAMSHEDVFMIVGGNGYRAKAASVSAGAKFAISKILVNKAARSARVSFYVPESGISQVDVSIYDIKGRQVWKTSQKVKAASWNMVEWNSRSSRRGAASTGLYIVRVKAIGANGRPAGADTKRIMFAR